jgi:hypothetical protein
MMSRFNRAVGSTVYHNAEHTVGPTWRDKKGNGLRFFKTIFVDWLQFFKFSHKK